MSHPVSRQMFAALALGATLLLFGPVGFAADPTLHQVYQAAEVGNYRQAQSMMDQVLHDHPNSAKAHFVEAELLAKQGRIAAAKTELDTAQRLEPGLPFAKPGAVQELQTRLSAAPLATTGLTTEKYSPPASSFPWGLVIVGLMLIAAIIFFFRRRSPAVTVIPAAGNMPSGFGAGQPYGYGGVGPMGPMSPMGGGTGSGILGSLATGAALGAGMVAGESLVHRMLDGGHAANSNAIPNDSGWADSASQYDIGGNDFGVADNSSWDDSSGGGGDDWS